MSGSTRVTKFKCETSRTKVLLHKVAKLSRCLYGGALPSIPMYAHVKAVSETYFLLN